MAIVTSTAKNIVVHVSFWIMVWGMMFYESHYVFGLKGKPTKILFLKQHTEIRWVEGKAGLEEVQSW